MTRSIQSLDIRTIAPRPNPIRPVDDDYAMALAVSFGEAQQLQPILVRPRTDSDGPAYELVCGGNRLRAAQLAERPFIDAEVREMTDTEARIAEIDENAVRKELSALDFALSMAERKRLYEASHPEAKHGGDRKKKPAPDQVATIATWSRFSKDAAKKTGLSERSIQMATHLANSLTPDLIDLVRGTRIADNAAALKKLTRLPQDQRRAAIEALAAGEAKSLNAALAARGFAEPAVTDPAMQLNARFADLLSRSNPAQRREWIRQMFRACSAAEMPALANALAGNLPAKGQKLVLDALSAVVSVDDEEAA